MNEFAIDSTAARAGGELSPDDAAAARLPSFWLTQVVSWSAYAVIIYVTFLPVLPADRSPWVLIPIKGFRAVAGFALTSILHVFYKRAGRDLTAGRTALVIASGSFVFGCLWTVIDTAWSRITAPDTFDLAAAVARSPRTTLDYVITLLAWSALYFGIVYWRDAREREARALTAVALANRAQLQMLRYQLNPHFLFNALNSIRALVTEDQARAKRMVTELSEFLRYSLLDTTSSYVALGDEVEAVRNYLAIEKIRFEDRLEVDVDVAPEARTRRLPGFLILPLVENAIKYGFGEDDAAPLRVRLTANVDATTGALVVEVANTRPARARPAGVSSGLGIGLANVRRRLVETGSGADAFELVDGEDGWTTARVTVRGGDER